MKYERRWISLAVITLLFAAGCGPSGQGGALGSGGTSIHFPFAVPGGPYDGPVDQPVQFDGSGSSDDEGHALTYEWDFGDGGTSTLAMPTHTYSEWGTYTVILRVCDASACNLNDGSTIVVIPDPANASPGGIWFGTDSEGGEIVVLITETGRFHFLDEFEFQGAGILIVSNGNEIVGSFRLFPPPEVAFGDGSPVEDCTINGSFAERATLDGTVECSIGEDPPSSVTVNLNYQALYDLDSSLAAFAGTWTDSSNPGSDVVNVDAMGVITGQDGSGFNCIYSGQVSIIDPNYNAYRIEWAYSSCIGERAIFNFKFSGIGAIDNTVTPTEFFLGATSVEQFDELSLVLSYEKM